MVLLEYSAHNYFHIYQLAKHIVHRFVSCFVLVHKCDKLKQENSLVKTYRISFLLWMPFAAAHSIAYAHLAMEFMAWTG